MEDHPIEYRELLRTKPNHSNIHKIHRWRHVTHDDNAIIKTFIVEATPKPYSPTDDSPIIDQKSLEKMIDSFDNNDWTGIQTGVVYSTKKRKRWLLASALENDLPDCDTYAYKFPYELSSVSLTRYHRHDTHCCSPLYWFYTTNTFNAGSLNNFADAVKSFVMKRADGTTFSRKKKMGTCNLRHLIRNHKGKAPLNEPPKFHLQFQTLELKTVPNHHNSRVYDYHPTADVPWKEIVIKFEPYKVKLEIPATGYIEEEDSFLEWMLDMSRFEDEELFVPTYYSAPPPSLTLGDFFDVNNIVRKYKKSDLKDWVVV